MSGLIRVGIINDTRNAHHMGCWLVMRNLFRLLGEHRMKVEWCWPTGREWRTSRTLNRRRRVDLVLVNAEGSIHDSQDHPLAERFASVAGHFKTKFDIPSVLINATVHNNQPEINDLLSDYALIFTRDTASTQALGSAGIDAETVSDLTLAYPLDHRNESSVSSRPMVTDSASRGISRQLEGFARSQGYPYIPIQYARFPHPHRIATPRRYLGKARRWIFDKIRHRPGLDRYISRIRDSSVVITGRYHAVTMCLLTAAPFLAVESSIPKISWLLQDAFGSTDRVVREVRELADIASAAPRAWSTHERARLDRYLESCQASNDRMMTRIRQVA
ncbi:polysaccharide pyruvyl transferase family protein [Wenzhouxiangella sp. EGI_FJ10409]|uniref:polysaccharide pyruvyl transferase family protein n=1 Tax=Wenzhouxiangella sp. EGI_FJ10409 TaxID=3243767 RepID=UPI0035DFF790